MRLSKSLVGLALLGAVWGGSARAQEATTPPAGPAPVEPATSTIQYPAMTPYVGLAGGGNFVLSDWDIAKNAIEDTLTPGSSFLANLRLGLQLFPQLAIEISGGYLPVTYSDTAETSATILAYNLDALFHLTSSRWAPYLLAGGGGYHLVSGDDLDKDFDPQFHGGAGFRGLVLPWLAVRAEGRYVASDGFSDWGSSNLEATIGIDIFPTRGAGKAAAKILDRDGDGVVDADDKCIDEPGPAAAQGCPDADGDGITDKDDVCPETAGVKEFNGCPDTDGDGIADKDDFCPKAAGKQELGGCPDTDNDGIKDDEDKCPTVAGIAAMNGCPDADGDGITDAEDACPNEAGKPSTKGCPDRDNDGIADKDDKCPDQFGIREAQGCMPEAAKKFTGAIKGIQFDTGKASIKKSSYKTLDAAVDLLKQFPTLRLRVEGHTDDVGNDDKNQQLSQARAESVRTYLVSKGIDAGRIEAVGYGETKPVADNKKAAGRAQNRRIEFTAIQ